ncbi:MAG: antibiotic biosynthesis monooxygenase [Eubacteriales bacterium]|nr:antibiotic biosynthesis monooxygenase [Eubacteriales bacterium]
MCEEKDPVIHPSAFIAPGAFVRGNVTLKENVNIWHNTVLHGDPGSIVVGRNTSIQEVSVVHVSKGGRVEIGENVNIGHGCIIHGCTIEDCVTVGMGAIIMDGAHIGSGSFIGAGSLITSNKEIPPNSLVMGSPARIVGETTEEQRAMTTNGILYYLEEMEKEKRRLFPVHNSIGHDQNLFSTRKEKGMIKIFAKSLVKEECVDKYIELTKELVEKSRAEEGNIFYSINRSIKNDRIFAFMECWKDQAALDFHNATPHFTGIVPQLRELCEESYGAELFNEI